MKNIIYRKVAIFVKKAIPGIFVSVAFSLVITAGMAAEGRSTSLTSLSGGETGKIYYKSSNPCYFPDLLDGEDNDSKVTVFGELKIPIIKKNKVPVIVIAHGGNGWTDVR